MLLDKFEFIAPENNSGFIPKEGSVKVIKNNQYSYESLEGLLISTSVLKEMPPRVTE
jgi:hypothetical protein